MPQEYLRKPREPRDIGVEGSLDLSQSLRRFRAQFMN